MAGLPHKNATIGVTSSSFGVRELELGDTLFDMILPWKDRKWHFNFIVYIKNWFRLSKKKTCIVACRLQYGSQDKATTIDHLLQF